MGVIQELFKKKEEGKGKKWGKEEWIILILAGIFFLIVFWPASKEKDKVDTEYGELMNAEQGGTQVLQGKNATSSKDDVTYKEQLEEQLRDVIESMDGIRAAKVMITLKTSEEEVVLRDISGTKETTTEEDSQGGVRQIETETKEENVCFVQNADRDLYPYVTYTIFPKVEGVLIVVSGNKTDYLRTQIVDAVQALFDVESHKVVVIKMKES